MNRKMPRIRLVLALFVIATVAFGCSAAGTAPAPTTAASEKSSPEPAAGAPSDADGAIAEIDRAEGELQRALGLPAFAEPAKPGAQAPGEAMAQAQPPPAAPAATRAADSASPKAEQESSQDACTTACRALAGMSRATGHLCDLSGEGDARCENARQRVRSATERVRSHCPACAAD
jgi:hypothetical protein